MPANEAVISPARNIRGAVVLPGDKSISHRYAILAAMAEGTSTFDNFATGDDCSSTLACLAALGATVTGDAGRLTVSARGLREPAGDLFCGNSGSTMRMLAGVLAAQPFESTLSGDESLSRRPMGRIAEPLRRMGAVIKCEDEHAPLRISGAQLRSIDYTLPVPSAQVKTCLLFAGLQAEGITHITEPTRTRDHTELALRAFGANIMIDRKDAGREVSIAGGQALHAIEATIPADISTAAYFLSAAALFPDSNLVIDALLLNPTRAVILDVLRAMGLRIQFLSVQEQHGELIGSIQVRGPATLKGVTIEGQLTTALIDEIPVLAAVAPFTDSGITIRDAGELRVKESDRLAGTAANLRAMGADVDELPDGLRIAGKQQLHSATVDSYGDHRLAMSAAIAGLRSSGQVAIYGADAVNISYPGFFSALDNIAER